MSEPAWLLKTVVLTTHDKTLREQGGRPRIRDKGLLDNALARPENLAAYKSTATFFDLAAAYGFGIARNHPFVDGNRRVAFYASVGFLRINGVAMLANNEDAAETDLKLTAGLLSESELARWLQANSTITVVVMT